jgi:hypothetical protein
MGKAKNPQTLDRVVVFVGQYKNSHGYSPTYKEIAEHAGIGIASAYAYVGELVATGKLARTPGCARSVMAVPERNTDA